MNPMTNIKNIKKLSEEDLKKKNITSWHQQYKNSAWIFVGGLSYDLTEGDIISVFSQYGEPLHINLVRDKDTGESKGYCFICYADQRSTDLAVDNLNGIKILGRTIRVDHVENYVAPKQGKDDNLLEINSKFRRERNASQESASELNLCEERRQCCSSESTMTPSTESEIESSSDDNCRTKFPPCKPQSSSSNASSFYTTSESVDSSDSSEDDRPKRRKLCKQKCTKKTYRMEKNIRLKDEAGKTKRKEGKTNKCNEKNIKEEEQTARMNEQKSKRHKKPSKSKTKEIDLGSDDDFEIPKKKKATPQKNEKTKRSEEKPKDRCGSGNDKEKKRVASQDKGAKNLNKKRKKKSYDSESSTEDKCEFLNKSKGSNNKYGKLKKNRTIDDLKREARLIHNELKRRQTIDLHAKKSRKGFEKQENYRRVERSRSKDGFREKRQNSSKEKKRDEDKQRERSSSHGSKYEKKKERSRSPANYARRSRSVERHHESGQKRRHH